MRSIDFSDGYSSSISPIQGNTTANNLFCFVDDAAFVTAKGAAAAEGDIYCNTTLDRIRFHDGTAFVTIPDLTNGQVALGQWTFNQKVLAKEGAGGGLDAAAAGNLELGATTASEVRLGKTGAITRVMGDLIIEGDTVTINTSVLDVEDKSVRLNINGNDASSEGAGIEVKRTGTNGSIIYAFAAASRFKIGDLGSEIEIANISSAQSLTNKTIDADLNTITNIENADIKTGAGIQRNKLQSGTADHVIINDGTGVMISEATLATSRGGTNIASYAIGDLLVATSSSVLSRLAVGTVGQVLKVVAGLPAWGTDLTGGGGGGSDFNKLVVSSTVGNILTSSIDGQMIIFI